MRAFDTDDELRDLLADMLDGNLDSDARRRLNERLADEPEAQRLYLDICETHAALAWEHGLVIADVSPEDAADGEDAATTSNQLLENARSPGTPATKFRRTWILAALATVASLIFFLLRPDSGTDGDQPGDAIATLTYDSHAKWADQDRAAGDAIGTGVLQLDVGLVRLDFSNGATVTLQGPAEFEVISEDRTRLHSGILTASIPESAVGFEVETPTADIVDLGTAFGVSVGANGETDVCVFEGEVEVSLSGETDPASAQLVREGTAVRTRPEGSWIESVAYATDRYEDAWPVTSGVLQSTGLIRFVSPGPDFVPGRYEDSEHILVFAERSRVVLSSDIEVSVTEPGRYGPVRRRERRPIAAGQIVRSYLLQFNPIGEFTREEVDGARVIGQITFDRPILGLIGKTLLLAATDETLGHPRGDYQVPRRGIEPPRPEDLPDSGRDFVTLSRDRRTLSLDLSASSAVDQIRVIVAEPNEGSQSQSGDSG
jgi:anti-sigma factor RsiW